MVTRKENIRPIIKEQMRGGDGRSFAAMDVCSQR